MTELGPVERQKLLKPSDDCWSWLVEDGSLQSLPTIFDWLQQSWTQNGSEAENYWCKHVRRVYREKNCQQNRRNPQEVNQTEDQIRMKKEAGTVRLGHPNGNGFSDRTKSASWTNFKIMLNTIKNFKHLFIQSPFLIKRTCQGGYFDGRTDKQNGVCGCGFCIWEKTNWSW